MQRHAATRAATAFDRFGMSKDISIAAASQKAIILMSQTPRHNACRTVT
jgi:hypothetical protein